jgi:hypothetical protein
MPAPAAPLAAAVAAPRFVILVDGEVVIEGDDYAEMKRAYRDTIDHPENVWCECEMFDRETRRRVLHTDPGI